MRRADFHRIFRCRLTNRSLRILKALLPAGDGGVRGDVLLIGRLDRRSGLVHLAGDLGEQLLVHLPVVAEGHHLPKAQKPCGDPDQEQGRRGPERQDESHGGRHIGQGQQERCQQPGYLLEVVLVADIAVLLIVPQGVRRLPSPSRPRYRRGSAGTATGERPGPGQTGW